MVPAAFERSEYETRLKNVEKAMAERGIDALFVTDPANINYLSGYDGWSFYTPQALVVVAGSDQPCWFGRPMDRGGAPLTTWLDDAHISTYPDTYIHVADRHPLDLAADLLEGLGVASGVVGVEMDAYYFSAYSYQRLAQHLPNARLEDATLLINWIRIRKSPQEIAFLRKAAILAGRAMAAAKEAISVGTRECDAATAIVQAQLSGPDGIMGDYPAIWPLIPSQERASACHLSWTDRRYAPGDAVNIELAGCFRRYHAPLARTVVLGKPAQRLRDLGQAIAEAQNEALAAVRPGITCADVEAVWSRVLRRHGYDKDSRLGYAVGLGYPPDWGEHTASLRPGDTTVLEPNMTFHMLGGMWLDGYGLEISETFVVTDRGVDVLTDFERSLIVKDA